MVCHIEDEDGDWNGRSSGPTTAARVIDDEIERAEGARRRLREAIGEVSEEVRRLPQPPQAVGDLEEEILALERRRDELVGRRIPEAEERLRRLDVEVERVARDAPKAAQIAVRAHVGKIPDVMRELFPY
jgi:chromosome segregation ATPase